MTSRIALCHEWLTTWGGSERVAQRMADVLGITDVFSYVRNPKLVSEVFGDRHVRTSRLGTTDFALNHWQWLLPIMPRWWRSLDLDAYDVVVTCSHSSVNSIDLRDDAFHLSYCCTPMRYAWSWRTEIGRVPAPMRPAWPLVATYLRSADRRRAKRVDLFLAVSKNVARLIERFYGRRSIVLYPPVDTEYFTPDPTVPREDFFLYAGRLVAYKRPDLAVQAATALGVRLIVAGSGPELPRLVDMAGPTVEFRTNISNEALRDLYRKTRAVLFPGIEDFGIVPVEAQACGTPVIAFAQGGSLETIQDGISGLLYRENSADGLIARVRSFDGPAFDPAVLRESASRFAKERFDEKLLAIVGRATGAHLDRRAAVIEDLIRESATP